MAGKAWKHDELADDLAIAKGGIPFLNVCLGSDWENYKPGEIIIDPLCEAGVVPIEAALFASNKSVNFYKKGKLLETTLTLEKQVKLPSKKDSMIVDKVTQVFTGSNKKMIYYYKGDTLAPLKIEQLKPGKDTSVMWRVDSQ